MAVKPMTIPVGYEDDIREWIRYKKHLNAQKRQALERLPNDVVSWAQRRFYIPSTGEPVQLAPHQIAILRLMATRDPDTGRFPYQTLLYSTIKQSGKSTIAGILARWMVETQTRLGEVYCIGNDQDQAKGRSFKEARRSIELSPGFDQRRDRLPGEWSIQQTIMRCQTSGSEMRALAVDAKGEAGGKPAFQVWTELWGFEHEDSLRFWEELTPIPTIPDSLRMVETYAGYENESALLLSLYEATVEEGRQLTAGELARRTNTPLGVFEEAQREDDPVPVYENAKASMIAYWDTGIAARRMPWQRDDRGREYYQQQEESLPPKAFRRLHYNEWVTPESNFIPAELWDHCEDPKLVSGGKYELKPGETKDELVVAVDAATTSDCFAIIVASRHPDREDDPAIRAVKVFDPKDSVDGRVVYEDAEKFLRWLCDSFNIVQIAYDPYQLEDMMQRLRRDGVAWCYEFQQGAHRLKADRLLYDVIKQRRLGHNGSRTLREHALNADAKLQKDQDSTLRIVKRAQGRRIDAIVAASMAVYQCLYLLLESAGDPQSEG